MNTATTYDRGTYGLYEMFLQALRTSNSDPSDGHGNVPSPAKFQELAPEVLRHPSLRNFLHQYLNHVHPVLPFLAEDQLRCSFDQIHDLASDLVRTRLYMVLAIGAVFPRIASFHDASLSHQLFQASIRRPSFTAQRLEFVENLLLFTIYSVLDSSSGSSWHLSELSMRTCISLGLHQKSSGHTHKWLIFWSSYLLERCIGFSLGLPPTISNDAILADPPSAGSSTSSWNIGSTGCVASLSGSNGPFFTLCNLAYALSSLVHQPDSLKTTNLESLQKDALPTIDNGPALQSFVILQLLARHQSLAARYQVGDTKDALACTMAFSQLLEARINSNCTMPWITGFGFAELVTALLNLLARASRASLLQGNIDLRRVISSAKSVFAYLSARFDFFKSYTDAYRVFEETILSEAKESANIDFLMRSSHFEATKNAFELFGVPLLLPKPSTA